MIGHRPRTAPRSRKRTYLGVDQLEHRTTPTLSTISANFNSYHIDAGDTIWFNSAGQVSGLGSGTSSLHVTDASVSFTANGTNYTVDVPDTTVTFTPLATSACNQSMSSEVEGFLRSASIWRSS